jgi:hypothetical protein
VAAGVGVAIEALDGNLDDTLGEEGVSADGLQQRENTQMDWGAFKRTCKLLSALYDIGTPYYLFKQK